MVTLGIDVAKIGIMRLIVSECLVGGGKMEKSLAICALAAVSSLLSAATTAEAIICKVYEDEAAFYAELIPSTITVVDFDYYPDGTPVPTGYDPAGNWSGFEIHGDEWSSWGVTFSSPSGERLSTVNETQCQEGNIWHNYSSPPNSLTPGQPPYVGYGVPESDNTDDSLFISLSLPQRAVGLVFVDNSNAEHVQFIAADGSVVADLPSPCTGYLSFLGVISDIPIAAVEVFEDKYDGDDVSYDDVVYGTPIPEPGALLLLGTGLAGLVGYGKLRHRKK